MKNTLDNAISTTSIAETVIAEIAVDSPSMYSIDAVVLLSFGDTPRYGGSFRVKATFVVDADFHASLVGTPTQEAVLLSETLRGIATNLQVPRVWFGMVDPVDGATAAIRIYVQGPAEAADWHIYGTACSIGT